MVNPQEQRILDVLQQFVSPLNARVLLRRACQRTGVEADRVTPRHLQRLIPAIQLGIRLFVPENEQPRALAALSILEHQRVTPTRQRLPIEYERDIKAARAISRRMCEAMGARSFSVQRVVTVVSELARNIVNYTSGGEIALDPDGTQPARIRVAAQDHGPGIPHLDTVLSGRYESPTGLGRGILGVKRLADAFNIETSAAGTVVEVELRL